MLRRSFLAGMGSLAGGCTLNITRPDVVQPAPALLPPVRSSMNRVTKTVVGLRPYRPSGYRLEQETFGKKTVVHCYGHGGCGVTLSWGTAVVAADMASATDAMDIAVLGCGVQGLTAALVLARRGHHVTIYAADLPPHTTSNIAGVLWMPTTYYDKKVVTPEFLEMNHKLIRMAWFGFLPYLNRPGYGVYWADHHSLSNRVPVKRNELPGGDDLYPELTLSSSGTLFDYPFQERFRAMIIDPDYYLDAILKDAQIAGAKLVQERFESLEDILVLPQSTLVNCTGLGAGTLFGDDELMPVSGQLTHLLYQPEVTYSYVAPTAGGVLYMFPRKTGLVLGGTQGWGNPSTEPDPSEITRMVEGHAGLATKLSA